MIKKWIESHWYIKKNIVLSFLLIGFSGAFGFVSAFRRFLYRNGYKKVETLAVPVVVVGNINVGGVGKTPLIQFLAQQLSEQGILVGLISRGYGGTHQTPCLVSAESSTGLVGDEALATFLRTKLPMVVGLDRVAAGRMLLSLYPKTQIILSDDGLQHYALARQFELVVIDGQRGLGNGFLLPMGPLRESIRRLNEVDAVVFNGHPKREQDFSDVKCPRFEMHLRPTFFWRLGSAEQKSPRELLFYLKQKKVRALAGIGFPLRFFQTLKTLEFQLDEEVPYPDHHRYEQSDVPCHVDVVLTTSKDAVKWQSLELKHIEVWVLEIEPFVTDDLLGLICQKLQISPHEKTNT
jgi:tetraacyldisaccharide 4'-kinase